MNHRIKLPFTTAAFFLRNSGSLFVCASLLISSCMLISGCAKKENPSANAGGGNGKDSLLFSFVTLGCNRIDKGDVSALNPSTANIQQLQRTYQEILALKPRPSLLFFVGDMILGYTNGDTATLRGEYAAWMALYEQSGLRQAGIRLIPAPGNHETLLGKGLPADLGAEQVWLRSMSSYIANNNGPKAGGADGLPSDESRLSYSFDYNNSHFLILNTDGVGRESRIPYRWAIDDLGQARNSGAMHIFALSHIPAWAFPGEDDLGSYPSERDTFWTAMENNQVEIMLSAHNHVYYRTRPHAGKTWQVIAGNGGSPLSTYINTASLQFFGFTVVEIYASGKVLLKSYGRQQPLDGYLGDPVKYPTTLKDSADLSWGK